MTPKRKIKETNRRERMKVIKRYDQYRRDLSIDMVCENCGKEKTYKNAYDDTNFWVNVVPHFKCEECGKSTTDLGLKPDDIGTMYPDGMQL